MRTYKYQIREHPKNKRIGNMLDDLADVHNHFLKIVNINGQFQPILAPKTPRAAGEVLRRACSNAICISNLAHYQTHVKK